MEDLGEDRRDGLEAAGDPGAITPPGVLGFTNGLREAVAAGGLSGCLKDDCGAECGFDGRNLACVSKYGWPQPDVPVARFEFFARYFVDLSLTTNVPLPGVRVDLCVPQLGCDAALGTETDATGYASVDIPLSPASGFRGFLRLASGSSGKTIYPTQVYYASPIYRDGGTGQYIYPQATLEAIGLAVAGGLVAGRGQLGVAFLDCANQFALEIELRVPAGAEGASVFYTEGGSATGATGFAAALNVMPGCYDIVGLHDGVETHRRRVFVEPDVFTAAYVAPLSSARPRTASSPARPTSLSDRAGGRSAPQSPSPLDGGGASVGGT